MAEYIDRNALLEALSKTDPSHMEDYYYNAIKDFPQADVMSVVHGRWIDLGDQMSALDKTLDIKMCSECHMCVVLEDFDDYCPSCGARMDVKKED